MDCLRVVRESEPGLEPPYEMIVIRTLMDQIWRRLVRNANYIMAPHEFAIFTYFRPLYNTPETEPIARRAAAMYWDNYTPASRY